MQAIKRLLNRVTSSDAIQEPLLPEAQTQDEEKGEGDAPPGYESLTTTTNDDEEEEAKEPGVAVEAAEAAKDLKPISFQQVKDLKDAPLYVQSADETICGLHWVHKSDDCVKAVLFEDDMEGVYYARVRVTRSKKNSDAVFELDMSYPFDPLQGLKEKDALVTPTLYQVEPDSLGADIDQATFRKTEQEYRAVQRLRIYALHGKEIERINFQLHDRLFEGAARRADRGRYAKRTVTIPAIKDELFPCLTEYYDTFSEEPIELDKTDAGTMFSWSYQ